jgi:pimeloyl-ACP methyl ester carboxylesterase
MTSPVKPNPVIFIHGLWIHATAWQPWLELFENCGYAVSAPGWPGERGTVAQTRQNPDSMNGVGIQQMVDHYAGIINARGGIKPLVVGHSFGGLIAQKLLADRLAAGAVAIDPAPIKGVKALPLAQLRSAFPAVKNPANRRRTVSLTPKQFHYAFGNTLSEQESNALHRTFSIPGPGKPLFEAAGANFSRHSAAKVDTRRDDRGPLLLTSSTKDHVAPLKTTKEAVAMYSKSKAETDFHVFEGRGHSLTIDGGWKDVAGVVLDWFAAKGF